MKKKGFTLVELLAVIAILAILVIVAMPNVLGMFNEAKVNTFVTDVQKIMDTAVTEFTNDSFNQSGKTIYYSSVENANLETSKLNIDASGKDYFIEMDRNGQFKRVVVYDDNYCYDVYSYYGNSSGNELDKTKTKILNNKFGKVYVNKEDVYQSGDDGLIVSVNGSSFRVKGCDALKYYDGTDNAVVPDGGKYTAVDGTVYNPGDRMPEYPSTGDVYQYGDYKYYYNRNRTSYNVWVDDVTMNGWSVEVISSLQSSYGEILTYINNKPVVSLNWLFGDYSGTYLETVPKIPNTVNFLDGTFNFCFFAKEFPLIPYGVVNMNNTFELFGIIKNVSEFPDGFEIPKSVKSMNRTFADTYIVKAPKIPHGVESMEGTFASSKIVEAPEIPSSVKEVRHIFENCDNLTKGTTFEHLTSITQYNNVYHDCDSLVDASNISFPAGASNLNHAFSLCENLVNPPDLSKITGNLALSQMFFESPKLSGTLEINAKSFSMNNSNFDFSKYQGSLTITGTCPDLEKYVGKFSKINVIPK